jgi:integrase
MALTAKQIPTLPAGFHSDGQGLYLHVSPAGARSWIFRFQLAGKRREMGIGSASKTTGPEARERAAKAREKLRQGIDPLEARKQAKAVEVASRRNEKPTTFADIAAEYIAAHTPGWRNAKHAAQWASTLATYAEPVFADTPVADIGVDDVLRALRRDDLWTAKPETASRVRSRIELVLSYAKAKGLRSGENPATWRGNLDALLPKTGKLKRVVHHPALPYARMGEFMCTLRAAPGTAARALEFAILTAARSGEVRLAEWQEIDRAGGVWNVPAERMKARRAHRVPLSPQALALLDSPPGWRAKAYYSPGSASASVAQTRRRSISARPYPI